MPHDEILYVFPNENEKCLSRLILKTPKTEDSDRVCYMTKKLREEMLWRKQQVQKEKAFYGKNYHDHNLVFCLPEGKPIEPYLNEKRFKK